MFRWVTTTVGGRKSAGAKACTDANDNNAHTNDGFIFSKKKVVVEVLVADRCARFHEEDEWRTGESRRENKYDITAFASTSLDIFSQLPPTTTTHNIIKKSWS
jgi:hypothetical protein